MQLFWYHAYKETKIMNIRETWEQMKLEKAIVIDPRLLKQIKHRIKDKQMLRPFIKGKRPNKQAQLENWKNSDEGKHMAKHCPKQYYETVQSFR